MYNVGIMLTFASLVWPFTVGRHLANSQPIYQSIISWVLVDCRTNVIRLSANYWPLSILGWGLVESQPIVNWHSAHNRPKVRRLSAKFWPTIGWVSTDMLVNYQLIHVHCIWTDLSDKTANSKHGPIVVEYWIYYLDCLFLGLQTRQGKWHWNTIRTWSQIWKWKTRKRGSSPGHSRWKK